MNSIKSNDTQIFKVIEHINIIFNVPETQLVGTCIIKTIKFELR